MEGIKKIAKSLNIKMIDGAKTNEILNHQYSGLDVASKPYLGKICAPDANTKTDADNQIASYKYRFPESKISSLFR